MMQNNERDETHTTAKENLRLIKSNADGLVERRGKKGVKQSTLLLLLGCAEPELAANGRPVMKIANGRLYPRLCDTSVCCNGTALSVLSRGVVARVFQDVIDRCAAPQNSKWSHTS